MSLTRRYILRTLGMVDTGQALILCELSLLILVEPSGGAFSIVSSICPEVCG